MKNKHSKTLLALAAAATVLSAPTAASAGNIGRTATEYLYGRAAQAACGGAWVCKKAGKAAGGYVFDQAGRFTNWEADVARRAGRAINRSYCRSHPTSRICR